MARLVIIAIDSMDIGLVHRFRERLPNISRMLEEGTEVKMRSTLPPDSVTAWATLYTGMNPAEHGMVHFADPLDKIEQTVVKDIDPGPIRGQAFWDSLSNVNKSVCVLNPHIGYPPWKVNGIMIGRSAVEDIVVCEPEGKIPEGYLNHLNLVKGIPTKLFGGREKKLAQAKGLMQSECKTAVYLLSKQKWDLFYFYTSMLDYIEHYFWSYFDPNDPNHSGSGKYMDVIPEYYRLCDWLVGEIRNSLSDDQEVMLVSDHGHGMRPVNLFNVNKVLKDLGFLTTHPKGVSNFTDLRRLVIESLGNASKKMVNDLGLGNLGMVLLREFPHLRKRVMTSRRIDWESTIAYVSDQSGMKAYTYGGVVVRRDLLTKDMDYESVRERIINGLRDTLISEGKESILELCSRREDVCVGPHIDKFPDILIVLRPEYGIGWKVEGPLFDKSLTHNIAPGSHRIDTPVMILSHKHAELANLKELNPWELHDIIVRLVTS